MEEVLAHTEQIHNDFIHRLCRICAEKADRRDKVPSKECAKFRTELLSYFAIDISKDTIEKFPTRICHPCYMVIAKFRTKPVTAANLDAARQKTDKSNAVWCTFDASKTVNECSLCAHGMIVSAAGRRLGKRRKADSQPSTSKMFVTQDTQSLPSHTAVSTASMEREDWHWQSTSEQSSWDTISPQPSFLEDILSAPPPPVVPPSPYYSPFTEKTLHPHPSQQGQVSSHLSEAFPIPFTSTSSLPNVQLDHTDNPSIIFHPQLFSTPKPKSKSPYKAGSPLRRRRVKMISCGTSPVKEILPSIVSLYSRPSSEAVSKDEARVCTFLAKRMMNQSADKETLILPTGGQPVVFKRLRKPRKPSKSTGPDMMRERIKRMSRIRHLISGGGESTLIQQAAEIKSLKKDVRDVLIEKLNMKRKVVVNKRYGAAMQAHAGFTYTQMRKVRQFLKSLGVNFENETAQRKELAKLIPHELKVSYKEFYFVNEDGDEYKKAAPLIRIKDVKTFIHDILDRYEKNGMLTWHEGGIPENEIWLKIGGDHGRDSFKICMQVANVKKPNSKYNTLLLGLAKVKDNPKNLKLIFEDFIENISRLNNSQWQSKQIRLFLFGDYSFLANVYGLSGATGKHPCLWCLKTKEEMQNLSQKLSAPRSLPQLKEDHQNFIQKSKGNKKFASKHHNVVRKPLLDVPLSHVAPPSLHILLGVVKKHHTILEDRCDEIDKDIGDEFIKKGIYHRMSGSYGKYLKSLKQKKGKLNVIKRNARMTGSQDEKLQDEVIRATEKLKTEISRLKKEKYPKRKGPVCSSLDEILKKHKIVLQAYHGRSFIGNHCKKYLQERVYKDLSRNVVNKTLEHTKTDAVIMKASTTAQLFNHLNALYAAVEKHISHSNHIPAEEYKNIETSINLYMRFYRKMMKCQVFPKLHFLEDHCLDWIARYSFGLGLHSEQGGEQLHKSIKILEIQSHGIPREDKKLITVMKKHLAQVSPDLLILVPQVKGRRKSAQ